MANAPTGSIRNFSRKKPRGSRLLQRRVAMRPVEAEYVATEIGSLVGTTIFSHNEGIERPLDYRDFAILCRSRKDAKNSRLHCAGTLFRVNTRVTWTFLRLPVIRDMVCIPQSN